MRGPGKAQPEPAEGIRPGALSALLQDIVRGPEEPGSGTWDRSLRPGVVVGRYELVREIGRGGFGVVCEARDRELGRDVAFKAVGPCRSPIQDWAQRDRSGSLDSEPNLQLTWSKTAVGRPDRRESAVLAAVKAESGRFVVELGCSAPRISPMKPADPWEPYHARSRTGAWLDQAPRWRVLGESEMRPVDLVVGDELGKQQLQVTIV